ncbi:MAG: hypothetical protein M1812_003436 [Candelaria pacifica]|nr:MAG: hypothetical protein M1812_003436 [Candelaria pacifica]
MSSIPTEATEINDSLANSITRITLHNATKDSSVDETLSNTETKTSTITDFTNAAQAEKVEGVKGLGMPVADAACRDDEKLDNKRPDEIMKRKMKELLADGESLKTYEDILRIAFQMLKDPERALAVAKEEFESAQKHPCV